jgi:hypothetical protein
MLLGLLGCDSHVEGKDWEATLEIHEKYKIDAFQKATEEQEKDTNPRLKFEPGLLQHVFDSILVCSLIFTTFSEIDGWNKCNEREGKSCWGKSFRWRIFTFDSEGKTIRNFDYDLYLSSAPQRSAPHRADLCWRHTDN